MFSFTKQERLVLIFLSAVCLLGLSLHYAFKTHPRLLDFINATDGQKLIKKIDVNKASHQELVDIPYIGEVTAQKIIDYRDNQGAIKNIDEIRSLRGINSSHYDIFSKYLQVK